MATTATDECQPNLEPHSEDRTQRSLLDISRAYFNAKKEAGDLTYVELPREDKDSGVLCGLLQRDMYGTRGAADGWQQEYSTSLIQMGF